MALNWVLSSQCTIKEAQGDSTGLLGPFAFFKCKQRGSMHRYITLAQVQTHSQASGHAFCSVKGRAVKSITCLKQRLENCLFPAKMCSGNSITVSALWSCRNVLAVNHANDATTTKTIPGNDCDDKLALLYFGMFDFYMTRLWFVSLTKMYSLRPSLKMLHEIFFRSFLRMIFTPFLPFRLFTMTSVSPGNRARLTSGNYQSENLFPIN